MEKKILPLLALRGKMVYPETSVYFEVSRPKSLSALEEAVSQDQKIFLVNQIDPSEEKPNEEDLYKVGTVARILQMVKAGQGILRVFVEGEKRAGICSYMEEGDVVRAEVQELTTQNYPENEVEEKAVFRTLAELLEEFSKKNPGFLSVQMEKTMERGKLLPFLYELASELPFELDKKQKILEETDVMKLAESLIMILKEEVEISDIRNEIAQKVKENVDKNQRDYILREQQKVIREELGEGDVVSESDEYLEKCEKLKASKVVKDKIRKEIRRYKTMPPVAAESTMMKNYIETMLEMPWNKYSRDNKDLNNAREILEEDHYGLEKVKDRILDYLAVHFLSQKGETPILCLVGPPGTGKTSIARSIARALNKKYVRISLGGVRDEAEIRGHRKTYVGAMPGRIAEGIRQAGVKNPVMLLDEIDKVSSDYKGDTASALLEVLDGEQNVNFRDHYLEVPLDLSEVFFIATANDLSPIAKPLLDRMEIIELSSYTENEKFHIAQNYLVKKQRKASGLTKKQVSISDEVIREIIHSYTREAGVRELERKIGQLMHKAARKVVEGEEKVEIKKKNLRDLLGTAPYEEEKENMEPQVGVVRGLAWTTVGGDTLSIEVNVMHGKGKLELTGSMGDVMKESARIGESYIRSVADDYNIPEDYFEKHDIHLHIPEGAVPKDGPSAGITMALAMLSAITKRPVRGEIAMTGELTLRGRVLPIGGLKEKLLAAKTVGVKEVFVPAGNRNNVAELDEEITGGMKITYVKKMEEVIQQALKK
ncbi:MAG: endopeptidase La [Eubacterium sp.]|nr:endopeptidase La [Eubacterium sp.]MDD7210340.1 endopeptidase La [Lachnospiraceae bacterium]MDY5496894.1 endopeptidase La [Anaerobutyricum sp.]